MKKIFNKSLIWEKRLEELLKKQGFFIEIAHKLGGFAIQPDFIVTKGSKTYIIELKVSDIITEKVLYQIMYYNSKIKSDLAYLAVPEDCIIKKEIKNKLLENNIGIITIKEKELVFEEPTHKKQLSANDLINYELFSENKAVEERVNKTEEELKNISIELFLYILTGGLLVYTISNLLEYYFEKPVYLWGLLIICISIILIIFIFYKRRINGSRIKNAETHNRRTR